MTRTLVESIDREKKEIRVIDLQSMDLGEVNKKRESLRGIWKGSEIDESLFAEARKSLFSYENQDSG